MSEIIEDLQDSLAMLKIMAKSSKSMLKGKGETIERAFNDVRKRGKEAAACNS